MKRWWTWVLLLVAVTTACGRVGPPVRSQPRPAEPAVEEQAPPEAGNPEEEKPPEEKTQ